MSNCPRCFHDNPPNTAECELCGAALGEHPASPPRLSSAHAPSAATVLEALSQADSPTGAHSANDDMLMDMRVNEVDAGMRMVLQDGQVTSSGGSAARLTAMGSGYRLCPQCAAANELTAISCVQCGASLETRRAPDPGKKIDAGTFLIAIEEDGSDGQRMAIEHENSVIGRMGELAYPSDAFLSPRHTLLTAENGILYAEDLNSLNGTYLKIRDEILLKPGDIFLMGRQVLRVQRFENEFAVRSKAADGTRYMGSPVPGGRLKIEQIGLGGMIQDIHCLSSDGAVIGREKGDVLFPQDKFMSSRHAEIRLDDDGEFYLSDQNSSNGSWLRLQQRRALVNGDFLFLGQQLFRIELPA